MVGEEKNPNKNCSIYNRVEQYPSISIHKAKNSLMMLAVEISC